MMNEGIRRSRWPRRLMQGALVVVVAGGAGYYFLRSSAEGGPVEYRFGTVERGTITNVVSSTGKVVAVGEVKISSQVAGQIIQVLADYNTPVTAGTVLARLDPEAFLSKVAQAEADLAISRASLLSNRASVERSQSDLRNGDASLQSLQAQLANSRISLEAAERDYNLQRELFARNVVATKAVDDATTKYEQAKTNFDQITANIQGSLATQEGRKASLAQSNASVTTAEAQVKQREAQLASAKIELERTVIKAPVDGTVIDRTAEVGQTIQNNSNTALFTVAQDLRQMQLEVSVDEADIGKIAQGMLIKFNVDAFPGREFQATVRQVRLAPKTVQNVVTYTIIASAPNTDMSLLPGMTATARVIIEERANAMRIPNSALRYAPAGYQAPAAAAPATAAGGAAAIAQAGQAPGAGANRAAQAGGGGQAAAQAGQGNRNAQPAPTAQTGGAPQGGAGGNAKNANQGGGAGGAAGALAQLGQLGLSEAQTQQVTQAIAAARTQAQAAGGTQQEIQQRLQQAQRQAILAALTPEQRTRFEAIERQQAAAGAGAGQGGQAVAATTAPANIPVATAAGARNAASRARAARVFVLGPEGKPVAIDVMIGITDGGFTEMVQGDVQPGTKVITGSNEVATAATANTNNPLGGLFGVGVGGGGGGGAAPQVFLK